MRYIIYDVVRIAGDLQTQNSYTTRMQTVFGRILSESPDTITEEALLSMDGIISGYNDHGLIFLVKKFMPIQKIQQLWDKRSHCPHKNDGLIFTLVNRPIGINTSDCIYKWKSAHTIDLRVARNAMEGEGSEGEDTCDQEGVGAWNVYAQQGADTVLLSHISLRGKQFKMQMKVNDVVSEDVVIECECTIDEDAQLVSIFPLKCRIDKNAPNSIKTIHRTMINILENVEIDELVAKVTSAS